MAAKLANQTVSVAGVLDIEPIVGGTSRLTSGLAATLTMTGSSVVENTNIYLPTGTVALHATGAAGDVSVGGRIDVSGTEHLLYDVPIFTDGGQISLTSDLHDITVAAGAALVVAAQPGGGNAGTLSVSASNGGFSAPDNTMSGQGGAGGANGNFILDVKTVPNDSVVAIDKALDEGGFTQSRNFRIRNVVDSAAHTITVGNATALNYTLSSDIGDILATGTINASGPQGGTINLISAGECHTGQRVHPERGRYTRLQRPPAKAEPSPRSRFGKERDAHFTSSGQRAPGRYSVRFPDHTVRGR
ncbi:MAG: hypothetical protein WDN28_33250 [Chthoniobacter sp.]